jgi:hypothetical protein
MLLYRTLFNGIPHYYRLVYNYLSGGLRPNLDLKYLVTEVLPHSLQNDAQTCFLNELGEEKTEILKIVCSIIGKNQIGAVVDVESVVHALMKEQKKNINCIQVLRNKGADTGHMEVSVDIEPSNTIVERVLNILELLCDYYGFLTKVSPIFGYPRFVDM